MACKTTASYLRDTTLASKIAAEAVAQRRTDPQASAPDVLHLVMTGDHHQDVDFDGLEPPAPFALIVPTVLVPALAALARRRGIAGPMPIDAVKLSHHGSRANVTQDLVRAANAWHFVFSTVGADTGLRLLSSTDASSLTLGHQH